MMATEENFATKKLEAKVSNCAKISYCDTEIIVPNQIHKKPRMIITYDS